MSAWIPYQPPSAERTIRSVAASAVSTAARRAALMMLVIAVLLAGGGGLLAAIGRLLTTGPIPPDLQSQMRVVEAQAGIPFPVLARDFGMTLLGVSAVVGTLSFWVRRGRLLPIVLSLVIDGFALLLIAVALVGGVVALLSVGGAQVLAGLSVWIIALAVCGLLFSWLVQAASAARQPMPFATADPGAVPPSRGMGYGSPIPPPLNRAE